MWLLAFIFRFSLGVHFKVINLAIKPWSVYLIKYTCHYRRSTCYLATSPPLIAGSKSSQTRFYPTHRTTTLFSHSFFSPQIHQVLKGCLIELVSPSLFQNSQNLSKRPFQWTKFCFKLSRICGFEVGMKALVKKNQNTGWNSSSNHISAHNSKFRFCFLATVHHTSSSKYCWDFRTRRSLFL